MRRKGTRFSNTDGWGRQERHLCPTRGGTRRTPPSSNHPSLTRPLALRPVLLPSSGEAFTCLGPPEAIRNSE